MRVLVALTLALLAALAPASPAAACGDPLDRAQYLETTIDQLGTVVDSVSRAYDLFTASDVVSPRWVADVEAETTVWHETHLAALDLNPPASLDGLHDDYLEALRLLDAAGDDVVYGVDTREQVILDYATNQIERAVDAISAVFDDVKTEAER